MKAKRTALLVVLACLIGAVAPAQLAVNNQGDVGLFTIPTADQPLPGHFTLGAYGWLDQMVAGDLPGNNTLFRDRTYRHAAGEFSLGFGFTQVLVDLRELRRRELPQPRRLAGRRHQRNAPSGAVLLQRGDEGSLRNEGHALLGRRRELPRRPLARGPRAGQQRHARDQRRSVRPADQLAPHRLGVGRRDHQGDLHRHGVVSPRGTPGLRRAPGQSAALRDRRRYPDGRPADPHHQRDRPHDLRRRRLPRAEPVLPERRRPVLAWARPVSRSRRCVQRQHRSPLQARQQPDPVRRSGGPHVCGLAASPAAAGHRAAPGSRDSGRRRGVQGRARPGPPRRLRRPPQRRRPTRSSSTPAAPA